MTDPARNPEYTNPDEIRDPNTPYYLPYEQAPRQQPVPQEFSARRSTILPPLIPNSPSTTASTPYFYPPHHVQQYYHPDRITRPQHTQQYQYPPSMPSADYSARGRPKTTNTSLTQAQISPIDYIPADPEVDLSIFTEEDALVLRSLLPLAEIHKWKYVATRLSKQRSKKFNSEFCIKKFHEMFDLPFDPNHSLFNSRYFLRPHEASNLSGLNFEGLVGSSLPYIVCKNGWSDLQA
ncbi:hypothetical protein OGAPHI_002072 [Ogataea philodendri]|uniref:Uncharacterized protein n=1 Tax=Ogataea philodendri TaxID=1378263 RepID=A0A9P8P9S5_9ASCO|nr:uncharacterized protein OGAPHI_002072 [Ogataea philodendri]KAH3668318.1 hypothetical protein OGAPHI_002072 [Ogataea philodendri]